MTDRFARKSDDQLKAAEAKLDAFTTALKQDVYASVRPVCIPDAQSRPDQVGSCILIQVADRQFMAAAAHVFDHGRDGNLHIAGDGSFVELRGTVFRTVSPTGARRDDVVDIGYIEITGDTARKLGGVRYFTPDRIDVKDEASPATVYAMIGYPHGLTSLDVSQRRHNPAIIAFTSMFDPEAYRLLGLHRSIHLPLQFLPRKMRSRGMVRTPPKPNGMSGGAVLRFDNLMQQQFHPGHDKLVGIILEQRRTPRSVIIAARIGVLLEAIVAEYQELRPAIPRTEHVSFKIVDNTL